MLDMVRNVRHGGRSLTIPEIRRDLIKGLFNHSTKIQSNVIITLSNKNEAHVKWIL